MNRSVRPTGGSRWLALVVLCAGMLMIILDATIVTVALPSIQNDLGFSQSGLAWVVNAYLIPFGGLLLLSGRLGDLIGRKHMFLAGLVVFVAASLWCGAAGSQAMLVVARFAQGIGGAMASSVILGMIVTMFPEPGEFAKAIGVFSFVGSAGASIGVLSGGILTQIIGWHWVFFVNLPIGIATVVLAARLVERDRGMGLRAGADVAGAALVTSGLMLGVYTIVQTTDHAWESAHTLGFGALAVALLGAFVMRQARAENPLLPLRIFAARNMSGANLAQAMMVAAMMGFQFLVALYLQRVLGFDALQTGLSFLPITVMIGVISLLLSARLTGRFGARTVLAAGLTFLAVGLAVLSRAPVNGRYVTDILPALLVLGVGAGLSLPAVTTLAMSGAAPSDAGLASGLVNTTQQVGGALGVAVLSTLATARTDRLLAGGRSAAAALNNGYHLGFGVGAVLVAAAVVLTAVVLHSPRAASAPSVRSKPPVRSAPAAAEVSAAPAEAGRMTAKSGSVR
jgi:EmrB/QacA subfamily drug resistance transporter